MAKLSQTDSRRMYSWWWNSHISPKNSKWLQENLTDMDVKVKSMIKLIEEDADSFARRAEMYYKKRPELMKMVEEFYRAYRALAERYDNATGVIRQAHHTMSEAFPNQVPSMLGDDSPASSVSVTGPRTPMSTPNGEFANESDSSTGVERVRRGLNFDELDEKEKSTQSNGNNHAKESCSEEILALKEALAKLEAEKKAGLVQYQQSTDKLSQLEAEISKTREDFRMLTDHANKAENEVSSLKEKLAAFEAEKESKLQEYQKTVEELNERASTSEIEAQSLKGDLDKLVVEKDAALDQYMHCLEIISILENKLRLTEEDATALKERAEKSESEVEILRQTIAKLTEEKEAAAQEYQRCLELISGLEQKLLSANEEIDNGFTKLKSSEEQCLALEITNRSLHSQLESLMSKFGTQSQELTEKQKELGRLWTCIQEERLRFVEAETAFQTLQHLHAQTQEELRAMASELQNRAHLLQVGETQNRSLQDEVMKFKEENKHLDELNVSSSLSIKDMQNEISSLMEAKGKLEEEVVLRIDQRNALQQEIYCLKEEINGLNKKHVSMLDQVHELGLDPESLGSSVKELRAENSCLKETCQRENSEKAALLEKMEVLEQLLVKNSLLETSLSDLNAELEAAKRKIETLEQSCQSFLEEKAMLMTQLQETDKNLNDLNKKHVSILDQVHELDLGPDSLGSSVKELRYENSCLRENCQRESSEKAALLEKLEVLGQLLVKNSILESSLSDLNAELEAARGKIEALEQSCQLFLEEKSILDNDKATLMAQLQETNKNLGILSKNNTVLEKFLSNVHQQLEVLKEKSNVLEDSCQVLADEKAGLMSEKDGLASQLESTRTRLEGLGRLYEELERRCVNLEKEKESTLRKVDELNISLEEERRENASCIQMGESKMRLLLDECREKKEDLDQALDIAIANELEIFVLRMTARGMKENNCSLLIMNQKLLEVSEKETLLREQKSFEQQSEIRSMKNIICNAEEENMESSVQLSVLLTWVRQLVLDSQKLEIVKNEIEHEREALLTQIEGLNLVLKDMKREKSDISEENRSLMDNVRHLEGKTHVMEEENYVLCSKVLALENLSLIFRIFADEKFTVFREIEDDRSKLRDVNDTLIGKLEESKSENVYLKERLHKTEDELSVEIESGKNLLSQMALQIQEGEEKINQAEKQKLELNEIVESLRKDFQREKSVNSEEKRSFLDNIRHLEGNTNVLKEENYALCGKVLALENLSLIFRIFADEKFTVFREIEDDRNKLHDVNATLIGKLEESKGENVYLKERLHKTEDELSVEIESGKKLLSQMALQLQEGEEKINQAEKQKLELNEIVENLRKDFQREKSVISEEKRSLMDNIRHWVGKTNVLEEENYALENLSLIFRIFADEKLMVFREIKNDQNKLHDFNATLIGKLEESTNENVNLKERLHKTEDELSVEIESGKKLLNQMSLQLQEAEEKIIRAEKKELELNEIVENLRKDFQMEKSVISEEKRSLMDNIRHLEGKTNALEEENYFLCSKVLALENLSLIFRIFSDEKLMLFREIKDDRNKLYDVNASLIGELEESKIKDVDLRERLHRTEEELSVEIESGKKLLNEMALQLQEAEDKINRAEKEKLELNETVENLRTDYNEVKTAQVHQENHILKLSADNDYLSRENNFLHEASEKLGADLEKLQHDLDTKKIDEENLHSELQKKVNEINELEILCASIFGQLHDSGVSQLIYEHKFHELNDVLDSYMDQNAVLKSQLAAYGPEIVLLKECIYSLENQADIHIKFPNPENEEVQFSEDQYKSIWNEDRNKSSAVDLHNLTVRLQAISKAAAELKDTMVQENSSLHSKLDETINQLEFLQSNQNGRLRRNRRPTSEITSEAENLLLTKDIVLDQISDGSSYSISNRQHQQPFDSDNQMVELWETFDPNGNAGPTMSKSKKTAENSSFRRLKSMKKRENLEVSKGSNESFGEGNTRTKVLERLDSDVQKLANLQITVGDLKRKLEVTEKGKRGKGVIECEAVKGQLEEADVAVVKLFELNGRLVKNMEEGCFSDRSSFDMENEGRERRRRVSKQAQRMSEKIGRLQMEVQRLQFVLMKMDEGKDGKSGRVSESKRRVVLRDYLYGVGQRRKKKVAQFCACAQPSTVED